MKKLHAQRTPSPGLRGRIWIDSEDGTFLGYGRIILLERIRAHGSITKAAKSMDISYRHAWVLIDSMNRQSPVPLIEASTGGRGGGGATVTEAGEQAITLFWKLHADFQEFLKKEAQILGFSASRKIGSDKDKHDLRGPHRRNK